MNIQNTRDIFGDEFANKECSICGQKATAMWTGQNTIFVCGACAVNALPALIADAIWLGEGNPANDGDRQLGNIKTVFWRALALRISGHIRPHELSDDQRKEIELYNALKVIASDPQGLEKQPQTADTRDGLSLIRAARREVEKMEGYFNCCAQPEMPQAGSEVAA